MHIRLPDWIKTITTENCYRDIRSAVRAHSTLTKYTVIVGVHSIIWAKRIILRTHYFGKQCLRGRGPGEGSPHCPLSGVQHQARNASFFDTFYFNLPWWSSCWPLPSVACNGAICMRPVGAVPPTHGYTDRKFCPFDRKTGFFQRRKSPFFRKRLIYWTLRLEL